MKQTVYVIHEKDLEDNEQCVIAVASSVRMASNIMSKYYGNYREIKHEQVDEGGIEWIKVLELKSLDEQSYYRVQVLLEYFIIDE